MRTPRVEVEVSADRLIQAMAEARERARMYLESGQSCDVAQSDAQADSGPAGVVSEKWHAAQEGLSPEV